MKAKLFHLITLFLLIFIHFGYADTIHIPADYPTFQEAQENAMDGDIILVAPGTYEEHIYWGNNVPVISEQGPEVTTISGTIFVEYSSIRLDGFTLTGYHGQRGGIITVSNSGGHIKNCIFYVGPDQVVPQTRPWRCLYVFGEMNYPEISYCTFQNHHFNYFGAGVYVERISEVNIHHCVFLDNEATQYGGGLALADNGEVHIHNNIFINNTAPLGAALNVYGCWQPTIYNNIFIDNTTTESGSAAVYDPDMPPEGQAFLAYNCFWNNIGGDFNENFNMSEGGNIFFDPMFVDSGSMDFHLDECSYCIDAGHPDSEYSNEPEPNGGRINMGIYGNTSEAATWGEDCPTRIPTSTPTPTPTFTPTFTPTPYLSPTPTPYICDTTGVTVELPKSFFHAGDTFYCTAHVCNRTGIDLIGYPLFVILDVHGEFFFAPSFSSGLDSFLEDYPRFENGETVVTVLPPFQWPENVGSMEGIAFIGALTDPGITEIIGEWDQKTFGWE